MLQQMDRPNTIFHRTIHAEGKWGRRYKHPPTYVIVTFWKVWCKSEMSIHMVNYTPMYVYARKSSWSPHSNTLEPEWPQHDCPIISVIS